ncbi:MAG: hypothetical protein QM645_03570 [Asticcacaulis sp.]
MSNKKIADSLFEAQAFLKEAKKLDILNRVGDAHAAFKSACQLAPDDNEVLLEYGLFLCKHNQWKQAADVILESTKYGSGPKGGFLQLAQCYRANQMWPEAYEAINNALTFEPQRAGVIHLKGVICIKHGLYDEAVEVLETLLKQRPDFEAAQKDYKEALELKKRIKRGRMFLSSIKSGLRTHGS